MEKTYSVALVGCGTICHNHLSTLREMPQIHVVALCDILRERAENARKSYAEEAKIYTDYQTMIDEVKPDAVHICTPHYLHVPMAVYALERGIHVFLEKPLATSEEDAEKLLAAEEKSSGRLCVCFQNRFNTVTRRAREIAEADGGVKTAFASVFWHRNVPYYTESGWRGTYATEGGGVMINQAIHTVDLLCQFLGKPVEVTATTANHHLKGIIEVEDTCEGVIRFESGKQANFYATTAGDCEDVTDIILLTEHHKIRIESPLLFVDGKLVEDGSAEAHYVGKACYGTGHSYLIRRFYEALQTESVMPVSATSAKEALDILLAAYQSSDTPVTLPPKG